MNMKRRGKKFKENKSLKNKQQLEKTSTTNGSSQKKHQSENLETVYNKQENKSAQHVEQKPSINDNEINISYKEHLVLVGIGIIFSIILYLVSFLV